MNDKEMLEMAAKAAEIDAQWDCPERGMMILTPAGNDTMTWNPLTDDGDSDRLGTAIWACVWWYGDCVTVYVDGFQRSEYFEDHNGDKQKALRWARVRCAAELGKDTV